MSEWAGRPQAFAGSNRNRGEKGKRKDVWVHVTEKKKQEKKPRQNKSKHKK